MSGLSDSFNRPINYLRISVTDRCNLRCVYCMPAEGVNLMAHSDILTYEEIYKVAQAAAELGISEITLQIHRGKIMKKMAAGSLAELVRMAGALEIPLTRPRPPED